MTGVWIPATDGFGPGLRALRHPGAGALLESGAVGVDRLLQPRRAALPLAEPPERVAEVVLGLRPVEKKHGSKRRRGWRKLHLATDADTGRIVAAVLTDKDTDDGSQAGPLLEQMGEPVASFTGDGAYDCDDVYTGVTIRHPDAAVIVPPRVSAVPSAAAETAPTQRDCHLQCMALLSNFG
jgi:hypothetical protein